LTTVATASYLVCATPDHQPEYHEDEDDLSDGSEQSVRHVLRHLDLSVPPGWQAPRHMSRQADDRAERWVEQYRERTTSPLA
jgi:hypothetical protein